MALLGMQFDETRLGEDSITPITNNYYRITGSYVFRIGKIYFITLEITCTAPYTADFLDIGTINANFWGATTNFVNVIGEGRGMSVNATGNKIKAYSGIAGGVYRGQIIVIGG